MALELYMVGLITRDIARALEFYRRLGLAIPEDSDGKTHVEIKMRGGLTLFLDSRPARWDPQFAQGDGPAGEVAPNSYPFLLEFYLEQRAAVDAKYAELTGLGYQGFRPPYDTSFGMRFAMLKDPDGNTVLLSGDA